MKEHNQSHLSNLIALAYADEKLRAEEVDFIISVGLKMGIPRKEIERLIMERRGIDISIPDSETERISQLLDFINIIMVDGEIDPREEELCRNLAIHWGFMPEIIDSVLQQTKKMVESNFSDNRITYDGNNFCFLKTKRPDDV